MNDAKIIQVIKTELETRGEGKKGDPCRIVTQYWDTDGKLLWEDDNFLEQQNQKQHENILNIFRWLLGYFDFPERKEGEGNYWWRKELRSKLIHIGFSELNLGKPKTEEYQRIINES